MMADRKVMWDPVNCNHGPGDDPIAEAYLCRAHDTDGCRFCHDSCDGFEVRRSRHNFDSTTPKLFLLCGVRAVRYVLFVSKYSCICC